MTKFFVDEQTRKRAKKYMSSGKVGPKNLTLGSQHLISNMSLSSRDELYITLPSNVPGSQRNTPADYETTLPTELLTGDWEVALLECHYFHDWSNLSKCDLPIYVRESDTNTPQNEQPASDEVDGHWFDEEDGEANAPRGKPPKFKLKQVVPRQRKVTKERTSKSPPQRLRSQLKYLKS